MFYSAPFKSNLPALFLSLALALGLGPVCAWAEDTDPVINSELQNESLSIELGRQRAALEYRGVPGILRPLRQPPEPMKFDDGRLENLSPMELGEQDGAIERPQSGVSYKHMDVGESIQQKLVEKQAYELFREHYRGAVQAEFIRRVHAAGFDTNRNIANEIKTLEEGLPERHPATRIVPRN